MSDFVILYHQMPPETDRLSHWDLMLRSGNELMTWALQTEPGPGRIVCGQALANHRLHYLDYEGDISNGRGTVSRFARGHYRWVSGPAVHQWQVELIFGQTVWLVTAKRDHCTQDPCFTFAFAELEPSSRDG